MNAQTKIKRVLISWIGLTDIRASAGEDEGIGPVAQAVLKREFDLIVLLSNVSKRTPKEDTAKYISWLERKTTVPIELQLAELSSPTNFGEIYKAVSHEVSTILEKYGNETRLTYHLSPGTPAMASVWIILAKTRYAAELLESSIEHGVKTATIPFNIAAEFIPGFLKRPDNEIEKLAAGQTDIAPAFNEIIHQSPEMKHVIAKAQKVAPRSVPILIEGESGTGKEMMAKAIHSASLRHDKDLIIVNCGAIPADLIESELFGHKKGTFTGATSDRIGAFQAADGGTIFLDEVGELPLEMQAKLLRVIQEKTVKPIGENKEIPVDFRIIAATNRNLAKEVAEERFREDLFYRLAVAVLRLPALRSRTGDLGLLIDHLWKDINTKSVSEPDWVEKKISVNGRKLLLQHTWPGNIRELQNTLTRAAVWSEGVSISKTDINDALLEVPKKSAATEGILNRDIEEGVDLQSLIQDVAQHYITRTLKHTGENKSKTASLLGLNSYQTLKNWMEKYGID